ncbi:MAG: hypothetical protein GX589_02590, partial [Deltaproteobacteria bacterium]|nr:hypothetical protein [Deltaproteobacteria bacterium]
MEITSRYYLVRDSIIYFQAAADRLGTFSKCEFFPHTATLPSAFYATYSASPARHILLSLEKVLRVKGQCNFTFSGESASGEGSGAILLSLEKVEITSRYYLVRDSIIYFQAAADRLGTFSKCEFFPHTATLPSAF